MKILGGFWKAGRGGIMLNEGGYLAGVTLSARSKFVDIWFRMPVPGWRSMRATRLPSGQWRIGRR